MCVGANGLQQEQCGCVQSFQSGAAAPPSSRSLDSEPQSLEHIHLRFVLTCMLATDLFVTYTTVQKFGVVRFFCPSLQFHIILLKSFWYADLVLQVIKVTLISLHSYKNYLFKYAFQSLTLYTPQTLVQCKNILNNKIVTFIEIIMNWQLINIFCF